MCSELRKQTDFSFLSVLQDQFHFYMKWSTSLIGHKDNQDTSLTVRHSYQFDNRVTSQHGASSEPGEFQRAFNCFGNFSVVFAGIPRIPGVNVDRRTIFKAPSKMATIGKELCEIFPYDLKRWYEMTVPFRYVYSLCHQFLDSCRFLCYTKEKRRDLH